MNGLREFVLHTLETMHRIYEEAVVKHCAEAYYNKGWITAEDVAAVNGWYSTAES